MRHLLLEQNGKHRLYRIMPKILKI